jgi:hypothetical protein
MAAATIAKYVTVGHDPDGSKSTLANQIKRSSRAVRYTYANAVTNANKKVSIETLGGQQAARPKSKISSWCPGEGCNKRGFAIGYSVPRKRGVALNLNAYFGVCPTCMKPFSWSPSDIAIGHQTN